MKELLTEIYQFLFMSSIIFIVYILSDLAIKMVARFMFQTDARFTLIRLEKILLWISLGIFLTYIIK